MHEWLSGGVALLVAVVLSIRWLISVYTESRVKEQQSTSDVTLLNERVVTLEKDLKEMAQANVALSNTLHAEINKILHKLAGENHG